MLELTNIELESNSISYFLCYVVMWENGDRKETICGKRRRN